MTEDEVVGWYHRLNGREFEQTPGDGDGQEGLADRKSVVQGKSEGRRRRGVTEDELVGWHHQLNGREFEQTLGGGEGQGSLACCSPRDRKQSDTAERLT